MRKLIISDVKGRQIIDSRGNPTVEAQVTLCDGTTAYAAVPSGASTGRYEALELRDNDMSRYGGKGVMTAVDNINNVIREKMIGADVMDIYNIDSIMLQIDRTAEKKDSRSQCHTCSVTCVCQSSGTFARNTAVSFYRRCQCNNNACSHDEYSEWGSPCG